MNSDLEQKSKTLSWILRHSAIRIGLNPDKQGWLPIEDVLQKAAEKGRPITRSELDAIVAGNDKQRLSFSEDGRLIRANQGHSFPVDLQLPTKVPPPVLYHGTVEKNVASILKKGLLPQNRHAVHMAADLETAHSVGSRRAGKVVILEIAANKMVKDGWKFQVAENAVWLIEEVPSKYLSVKA